MTFQCNSLKTFYAFGFQANVEMCYNLINSGEVESSAEIYFTFMTKKNE